MTDIVSIEIGVKIWTIPSKMSEKTCRHLLRETWINTTGRSNRIQPAIMIADTTMATTRMRKARHEQKLVITTWCSNTVQASTQKLVNHRPCCPVNVVNPCNHARSVNSVNAVMLIVWTACCNYTHGHCGHGERTHYITPWSDYRPSRHCWPSAPTRFPPIVRGRHPQLFVGSPNFQTFLMNSSQTSKPFCRVDLTLQDISQTFRV